MSKPIISLRLIITLTVTLTLQLTLMPTHHIVLQAFMIVTLFPALALNVATENIAMQEIV